MIHPDNDLVKYFKLKKVDKSCNNNTILVSLFILARLNMNKKAIKSILETKSSGNFYMSEELLLPDGKSIAELLYEQEKYEDEKDEKNQ